MSIGLVAWDESGNLILDYTDRIAKVAQSGLIQFTNWNQTINVSVPGISDTEAWAVIIPDGHYSRIYNGYFSATSNTSTAVRANTVPYTVIKQ